MGVERQQGAYYQPTLFEGLQENARHGLLIGNIRGRRRRLRIKPLEIAPQVTLGAEKQNLHLLVSLYFWATSFHAEISASARRSDFADAAGKRKRNVVPAPTMESNSTEP